MRPRVATARGRGGGRGRTGVRRPPPPARHPGQSQRVTLPADLFGLEVRLCFDKRRVRGAPRGPGRGGPLSPRARNHHQARNRDRLMPRLPRRPVPAERRRNKVTGRRPDSRSEPRSGRKEFPRSRGTDSGALCCPRPDNSLLPQCSSGRFQVSPSHRAGQIIGRAGPSLTLLPQQSRGVVCNHSPHVTFRDPGINHPAHEQQQPLAGIHPTRRAEIT